MEGVVVVVDAEKAAQQHGRFFPGLARDPEVRLDEPHNSAAATSADYPSYRPPPLPRGVV